MGWVGWESQQMCRGGDVAAALEGRKFTSYGLANPIVRMCWPPIWCSRHFLKQGGFTSKNKHENDLKE